MSSHLPLPRHTADSVTAGALLSLVGGKLNATEELLRQQLSSEVPLVEEAGEYIFSGGGKRMRPAMLLLVSRMLGFDGDEEVTYAATVEFIHSATLVHDDMIDQAALRRGKTAVHRVWGNNLTVLLGDWLYTTAMQMALSHDRLAVVQRLCSATLKMIEGELLAQQQLGAAELSREEYFRIIELKTAHLFSAATSIPACMAPTDPEWDRALQDYGRSLGICFQLVDDLLDYTAREADLGKPVLSDLKEGKLTLPLLLLLPRISDAQRQRIHWVLEDRAFARVQPEEILEMVHSGGTLDETFTIAQQHGAAAVKALAGLPAGDARDALELAPHFVLNRRV